MYNNNFYPYQNYGYKPNLFGRFSSLTNRKFNWASILNNTQRTLNIINQAIPVIYQMKPIYNNAKTIFRVMNAVKEPPKKVNTVAASEKKENPSTIQKKKVNQNSPTFFL